MKQLKLSDASLAMALAKPLEASLVSSAAKGANTVEAYCETFGLKGAPLTPSLGVEHLLNEDDRAKMRAAHSQMRSYLEDLTEDNDGLLSTKASEELAEKISEEMRTFSKKLIERKEKEKIQDLANTSQLPGKRQNPEQPSMLS